MKRKTDTQAEPCTKKPRTSETLNTRDEPSQQLSKQASREAFRSQLYAAMQQLNPAWKKPGPKKTKSCARNCHRAVKLGSKRLNSLWPLAVSLTSGDTSPVGAKVNCTFTDQQLTQLAVINWDNLASSIPREQNQAHALTYSFALFAHQEACTRAPGITAYDTALATANLTRTTGMLRQIHLGWLLCENRHTSLWLITTVLGPDLGTCISAWLLHLDIASHDHIATCMNATRKC